MKLVYRVFVIHASASTPPSTVVSYFTWFGNQSWGGWLGGLEKYSARFLLFNNYFSGSGRDARRLMKDRWICGVLGEKWDSLRNAPLTDASWEIFPLATGVSFAACESTLWKRPGVKSLHRVRQKESNEKLWRIDLCVEVTSDVSLFQLVSVGWVILNVSSLDWHLSLCEWMKSERVNEW